MRREKLRTLVREYSERNRHNGCSDVYSVTNSHGFIPSTDFFSKEVFSKDLSTYKIVKRGMIAYNPSRINVGSVAVQREKETVIVSPLYVVFSVDESKILPDFLTYFLHSDTGLQQIAANTSGSVRDSLKFTALQNIKINLYSIEEQQDIIAILNKVGKLLHNQKEALQKIDDLVKSQFIEMFGDPKYNSKNLPIIQLGDLCRVGSSKRIYQDEQTNFGVPFLRISDLNNLIDGGDLSCELYIPTQTYESLKSDGLVPSVGDILVTSRGTLGRCYIVKNSDRFYFQDGMITWLSRLSDKVTGLYISQLFETDGIKEQIASLQAGSTVAYLSIAMTKKLKVMIPPIELQNEFATFVEQTDKSKVLIREHLFLINRLRKVEKTQQICYNIFCKEVL